MISEKRFVEVFNSFWQELLPTGERFIRRMNLGLERFAPPLLTKSSPEERGLVNEIGFRLFCKWVKIGLDKPIPKEAIPEITNETVAFIKQFRDASLENVTTSSNEGIDESIALAGRLRQFFVGRTDVSELVSFPQFSGCGRIDTCEGDVIGGTTLYEVKAGDRGFRLVDLRQVLVYCALNHARHSYQIERVVLLNPRRGVFFSESLDSLCREIAGSDMNQVMLDIIEFVSQPIASV